MRVHTHSRFITTVQHNTIGSKIVDSGTKNLKSSYTSNVTLIASGGTYTFSFDKTTGALKVTKK